MRIYLCLKYMPCTYRYVANIAYTCLNDLYDFLGKVAINTYDMQRVFHSRMFTIHLGDIYVSFSFMSYIASTNMISQTPQLCRELYT